MDHIYLKAVKKATIISKKVVFVEDVAELQGSIVLIEEIKKIKLFTIPEDTSKNYLISVMDIIEAIHKKNNQVIIHSLGEKDTIISYKKNQEKEKKLLTLFKIGFVGAVLITGSAVAIMAFHTDTQLPKVFTEFYDMFLGSNSLQPYLIEIPYSIGLAVGISVFFNHFSKIKFTNDPTPIEVELKLYENQVDDSIIETLKEEKEGEK
ncbi:MAG: hypothetical protein CVU84_05530 [Firmicutes bacterium HGW-Firmicutes-1]|jgi:stage V sporulation protein AA|nr:MAG: hypothetical protein CVU84_05530 [Firmicutes bacterium HGW-Firmicutes-1]